MNPRTGTLRTTTTNTQTQNQNSEKVSETLFLKSVYNGFAMGSTMVFECQTLSRIVLPVVRRCAHAWFPIFCTHIRTHQAFLYETQGVFSASIFSSSYRIVAYASAALTASRRRAAEAEDVQMCRWGSGGGSHAKPFPFFHGLLGDGKTIKFHRS